MLENRKIITGVSACQDLLDIAVQERADAVLVHHGYFWRGEDFAIVGIKKQRLQKLLTNNINLIAYHLPLDQHAEYGNNVQLAKLLQVNVEQSDLPYLVGCFTKAKNAEKLVKLIAESLQRKPLHIPGGSEQIKSIAICSGAGQDYIEQIAEQGIDAYITGEISERAVYIAREAGIHLFAAGHHATERYGIKSLGEHLAQHFNLEHHFVDIDNPV